MEFESLKLLHFRFCFCLFLLRFSNKFTSLSYFSTFFFLFVFFLSNYVYVSHNDCTSRGWEVCFLDYFTSTDSTSFHFICYYDRSVCRALHNKSIKISHVNLNQKENLHSSNFILKFNDISFIKQTIWQT